MKSNKDIIKSFDKSSKILKKSLLNSIGLKNETLSILSDRYIEEMKIRDITDKYNYNDDSYTSNKIKKAKEEMLHIIKNEKDLFDDNTRKIIMLITEDSED